MVRGGTIVKYRSPMVLSNRHQRTLERIFETPTRADVGWRDIEALFGAAGGDVTQGKGSRVRVALSGVRAVFHRPHPRNETDKGALKSVRDFLTQAGITPEPRRQTSPPSLG